jgi:hypothetical protein
MILLLYLALFLAIASLIIVGIMLWAKFWPTVSCDVKEVSVRKTNVGGRDLYLPRLIYSYDYKGAAHESSNVFLFGGRSFLSEKEALEFDSVDRAYICPLNANWSYLKLDPRVFWGLLSVSIFGLVLSLFISFLVNK